VLKLYHGLIVSCQAGPQEPLHGAVFMAAMARAAVAGGAVAIRAGGPADVTAIRDAVAVPLIGCYKANLPGLDVQITPTLDHARQIRAAGADLIALDATNRPRPGGVTAAGLIASVQAATDCPVIADVATLDEGVAAAEAGADVVATTLAGYTDHEPVRNGPDFELIRQLAAILPVPLIAEGRIATPEQARRALDLGAYAVVIGAAITRPQWITKRFVMGLNHQ